MLKNYILIAFRTIARNRTVSFINIFGFAISMSICLLLILIIADQFSYDDYHAKKDRIYRINTERIQLREYVWNTATTALPLEDYLKDHAAVEESTVLVRRFGGMAEWDDHSLSFEGNYADNAFFRIFDFPFAEGSPENALTLPNSIVLSHAFAKNLFGDTTAIGKVISVEHTGEFIVTGVLQDLPGKTHLRFDALASRSFLRGNSADSLQQAELKNWSNIYDSYLYVLAREGADIASIKPALAKAAKDNYEAEGDFAYEFQVQALTGITPGPLLSNNMGFGLPDFVIYVMLGIALVVLLSACFNYANLTTARAMNRAKEIGVRKVVGARNRHVFYQFIIEAIVVALIAFILADFAVQFLLPGLNNYLASLGAPMKFTETRMLYVWFILFAMTAGFIAGLFPAVFFSRTNPVEALKRALRFDSLSRRLGFRRFDVRKVLVVIQFTFTIFFVITLVTIYQQTRFVLTKDHGFRTTELVNIHLQGQDYESFRNAVTSFSTIREIGAATHLPALGTNNTIGFAPGEGQEEITASYFGVDQGYIPAMDLELLAGSNFPDLMPDEERYIIINEQAVAKLGLQDPHDAIGRMIRMGDGQVEILGVLKDFHYERLDEQIGPMFLRYKPEWAGHAILHIDKSNQKQALQEIEDSWHQLTIRPFEYTYLEDDIRLSYGHFEALLVILGYITVITVSIACLGLLGMVIYQIQNKTKELGIRKTLGAGMGNMLFTLSKGFMIMILLSYLIASPLAYFVNMGWLQMNAYRIDFGLPTFLTGFIAVMLVVTLTIGGHLYKAMKINPVDSLRSE